MSKPATPQPRKQSRLGRILGALGFLAIATKYNRGTAKYAGTGMRYGSPIFFPQKKKWKGIDKEKNRKNSQAYNKSKK